VALDSRLTNGAGVMSFVSIIVAFVAWGRMRLEFGRRRISVSLPQLVRGEWHSTLAAMDRVVLARFRAGLALALIFVAIAALMCAGRHCAARCGHPPGRFAWRTNDCGPHVTVRCVKKARETQ
jgi:hypothetical protein